MRTFTRTDRGAFSLDGVRAGRRRRAIGVIFIYPIVFPIIYPVNQHENVGRSFVVSRRMTGNRIIGVYNTLTRSRTLAHVRVNGHHGTLGFLPSGSFAHIRFASSQLPLPPLVSTNCVRDLIVQNSIFPIPDVRGFRTRPAQTSYYNYSRALRGHTLQFSYFSICPYLVLGRVTFFSVSSEDVPFKSDFVIGHAPLAYVCGYWSGRHLVRCYFRRPPQNCRQFGLFATTKSLLHLLRIIIDHFDRGNVSARSDSY